MALNAAPATLPTARLMVATAPSPEPPDQQPHIDRSRSSERQLAFTPGQLRIIAAQPR